MIITVIILCLREQYDQDLHCLPFHLHFLDMLLYGESNLFKFWGDYSKSEPRHDKTNKAAVHPTKTQISLGICPVWSVSLLSAWRKLGSLATHWAHGEDSDQTGWMSRLIWVFAGLTVTLLVLSCCGSFLGCLGFLQYKQWTSCHNQTM